MLNEQHAIVVNDLVKVFREKSNQPVRAIDGLSLTVRQGEIFGLLGRNGAGKTTLLRILTTLIPPTSGQVSVLGLDVQGHAYEIRKNICVVLQENAVELYLSVIDNLITYARFHSISGREIPARINRVIDQFGLEQYRNQKVIDLSGGLKRRVQVAKVFMVDTPLLFLDEATTGMDPINKRATIEAIRMQARGGRTIFLTTHILQEAEELCDTIAIIDRGRCVASGGLSMIKSLASDAFDLTVTFDHLDDRILDELRTLPVLRMSCKETTVELSLRGKEISALEILSNLSRRHDISGFEVRGATLEDVFLELLGGHAGQVSPREDEES
jgi:ABC-2 type transport system ATP-binding protein